MEHSATPSHSTLGSAMPSHTPPIAANTGELIAALVTVQKHHRDADLRISIDSTYTIDAMTTRARENLRRGFVGVRNAPIVQALTGELIRSTSKISIRKVKGHSGDVGNDGADELAGRGALKTREDRIDISLGVVVGKVGADLQTMTQALAYRAIRKKKEGKERRRTASMVSNTLAVVEEITGINHTPAALWRSLRRRREAVYTQKFSAWAWKTLHMGYKIGRYWRHFLEERTKCGQCPGEPDEDMDHILCECLYSGQSLIWEMAKETWAETGQEWPNISLGLILGSGLVEVKDGNGNLMPGKTRLLRILISESAYLAWVLRCEWRIGRESDPSKIHTEREVRARWTAVISRRIRIDKALTNERAYGRKALKYSLVQATWGGLTAATEFDSGSVAAVGV
ncbi:hypothetical protein NMY22_g15878 [Coprinellus aureogranulatus]|nr:hypothetical protein NMY22_g15878 [Coprinellus aureogranulatus]